MQGSQVLDSASRHSVNSPILQAELLQTELLQTELLDATDIIALQLADEQGPQGAETLVIGAQPRSVFEELSEDALLDQDFATLTQSLKTSYAELQTRVNDLTDELTNSRAARQQELAEKEQLANRLTALVDALPGGVLVLDRHHTIILANPVAAELLGEPLLNMNFLTVIAECAASMSRDGTQILLRSGRRVSLSNQVHDGYGDQVVLITDVTETYAAQAASHRDERLAALGAMVARLAHQIRTPLASALLYLGAMQRANIADAERCEIGDKVKSRLKHLESLVNDSLQYVKGGETSAQDCSLFELLDALKASVAPLVAAQQGAWVESRPAKDIQILANQEALLSALVAIAENALQVKPAATIQLAATLDAAGLTISITDDGPGINPDIIEHIFDPYYTTRPGGTGLGLALSAVIARNHDALLTADNVATGGAIFSMTLPRERLEPNAGEACGLNTDIGETQHG